MPQAKPKHKTVDIAGDPDLSYRPIPCGITKNASCRTFEWRLALPGTKV